MSESAEDPRPISENRLENVRRASSAAGAASTLLEREEELSRIGELLDTVRAGSGRVLLVTAAAGLGKTSLLRTCADSARERHMNVLAVRGDDVVTDSSFAAVRELLWSAVNGLGGSPELLDGAARLALPVFEDDYSYRVDPDRAAGVLHGLYWLVASMSERRPLALLVDDGHWLDDASARFLVYLARRVDSLPVLLAVAARQGEGQRRGLGFGLVSQLSELAPAVLSPGPLRQESTTLLVRRALGADAGEQLCLSCHEATGGNPLFLRELMASLKAEPQRSALETAEKVRQLGADAVRPIVLMRLARLGSDCERVAEVLAVLAPGSPLRQVALLAGLARERAQVAADRLREAALLAAEPELAFAHPIVREAVAAELSPSRKAALHLEAARLLAAEGAARDRVAAHLVSAEPFGERWVIETLRAAAREALAQGAPEAAVSYLRRALVEPPEKDKRLELLVELGRAEALLPGEKDFAVLREAHELATDPFKRAQIALELAWAVVTVGRFCEVPDLLEPVLELDAGLPLEMRERTEALLLGAGGPCLRASKRLNARAAAHLERAERGEVEDPVLLAALAQACGIAGVSAARIARLARLALEDARLFESPVAYVSTAVTLAWADDFERAAEIQDAAIAEAQRRGSPPLFVHASRFRAETALRAGELRVAEGHLQPTIQLARDSGAEHIGVMFYVPLLLELGPLEEAEALVSSVPLGEAQLQAWQGILVLANRGRVRVALRRLEPGVEDLLHADRRMRAGACQLSVLCDWVPTAVDGLVRLARRNEAVSLAERELDEARAFGAARRLGMSLSTCGLLDPGDRGLELLGEAVAVLEPSSARLEHARALVNLGSGLRERGRPAQAREPLARGLDLADRCGAGPLAQRAERELVATGARPRRRALSGRESLTPAELRTARLAAEGLSNREIAEALFVSMKTVEWQLTHAYAKLEIGGRKELAAALAGSHSA